MHPQLDLRQLQRTGLSSRHIHDFPFLFSEPGHMRLAPLLAS